MVPRSCDGMRAGEFLKKELACSAGVRAWIRKNPTSYQRGGIPLLASDVLRANDRIELLFCDEKAGEESLSEIVPNPNLPLSVCFENEHVLVINKPAGMPTHPSLGHYEDTLANALAAYAGFGGVGMSFRPVNRLDRNTSGTVLVAKSRFASAQLSESMRDGEVHKYYLALTDLCLPSEIGEIRTDIRRAEESIINRTDRPYECREPGAQSAVTRYRLIRKNGSICCYLVRPMTGRTHQIRVHFASLGCPLLGDDLYGEVSEQFPHQALHSMYLSAPDVILLKRDGGHRFSAFAPPPESLLRLAGVSAEELSLYFEREGELR